MKRLLLSAFIIALTQLWAQQPALDWAYSFGGSPYGWNFGGGIQKDNSGNIISAGRFQSTVDFDPSSGTSTLTTNSVGGYILKLEQSGNFVWVKGILGTDNSSSAVVDFVATDANDNIFAVGVFQGTVDFDPGAGTHTVTSSGSYANLFILKLDASGNFQWVITREGGDMTDTYIAVDMNGNIYVPGLFSGTMHFDPNDPADDRTSQGGYDGFILKFDTNGNYLAGITFGGSGDDYFTNITFNSQNNPVVTGIFQNTVDMDTDPNNTSSETSQGGTDVFVQELNASTLYTSWYKIFGGSQNLYLRCVKTDASDNIYLAGTYAGQIDLDPGSGTHTVTSSGNNDIFLVQLDNNGNYVNGGSIGSSTADDFIYTLNVSTTGDWYLTGAFAASMDFDPTSGTNMITPVANDMFILKYNPSLQLEWFGSFSSSGYIDNFNSSFDETNHELYYTGFFSGTCDFDPGTSNYDLTAVGYDIFVSKITEPTASVSGIDWGNIRIYPNPVQNDLHINSEKTPRGISLIDARGRELQHFKPEGNQNTLHINGPSGIYYLKLDFDGQSKMIKIIKQ